MSPLIARPPRSRWITFSFSILLWILVKFLVSIKTKILIINIFMSGIQHFNTFFQIFIWKKNQFSSLPDTDKNQSSIVDGYSSIWGCWINRKQQFLREAPSANNRFHFCSGAWLPSRFKLANQLQEEKIVFSPAESESSSFSFLPLFFLYFIVIDFSLALFSVLLTRVKIRLVVSFRFVLYVSKQQ